MAQQPGDAHFAQALALADKAVIELRQWLSEQPHQRLLLLCDPAAGDAAADAIAAEGLQPVPLALRHDDVSPESRPYLVEIESEQRHDRLVAATLTLAVNEALLPMSGGRRARSVCAWLHTARPVDELARVMGARGVVAVQGQPRLLRFWDPRVLAFRARGSQAGPADAGAAETTWLFINWLGELCRWRGDDGAPFDHKAIAALAPVGALNAVLQRVLHRNAPDRQVPWARAEAALRWARANGIAALDDQVRLAADMVRHGEDIVHAGELQPVLAALRARKGSYAGATAEFEDQDWQRLAAEGLQARQIALHAAAQGQTT